MGTTLLSLQRAGSVAVLAAMLLAGCGDDGTSDGAGNGDEVTDEMTDGEQDGDTPDGGGEQDDETDETADESGDTGDSGDPGDSVGDVMTLEVTIADDEVSPPFDTYEVALGTDVRIEITSDTADELHLHGYDLELTLEPGEQGVLEFTADIEGRFELETHELGLQLLQLEVG